ncbi:MAG: OmpA family protein [Opitutaceae bacterium]|nr:OmpA family protein [Cytophagales bacterium]
MKKYILIISYIFFSLHLAGQQKALSSTTLIRRYKHVAEKSFKSGNYSKSIIYHQKLDSLIPDNPDILYNIGVCYLNSNFKHKALNYFLSAQKLEVQNSSLSYNLGKAYHHNHKFDEAKKSFEKSLVDMKEDTAYDKMMVPDIKRRMEICELAKTIVADSIPVEIENIGDHINTENDEYVPIVSADQQVMYFTSRRKTEHNHRMAFDGRFYEDIYFTQKDSVGNWGPAIDAGYPINGAEHDACIGITADAQTLFLYRMKSTEQFKGNILSSKLKGDQWGKPVKLGSHINTKRGWESSISISEDNHRLYFSSDRPGGQGGLDVWYCELLPTKEWGEPQNAGPSINTEYDEDCPFIHFDDKTLFFSSTGHHTMGGYDVFSTVLNTDSNTWSKPRNIGYPINSTDDDMYFVYSADGSKGYMSTSLRADGLGERDIYVVNRPNHSKKMIVLKGNVIDEENNLPVEATITITDLQKNEVVGVYSSNSKTGKYVLALDYGKNYSIQFEADNFIFHSENVNINSPEVIFAEDKSFKMQHIKPGNSLVLNNIFFDLNKYDLKNESLPELDKLLDFMKKHPHVHIEVSGHTDSAGKDSYNIKLSKKRAKSVRDYLIARDIPKKNFRIKGFGESKPVASNATEEGRKLNRRTECLIYDMDALPKEQQDYLSRLDTANDDALVLEEILDEKKLGAKLRPQVHFLYNNGVYITEYSKKQMEKVCEALKRVPNMKLEIHGSTDLVGNEYNNKNLYEKRVHTVLHYFLDKGFQEDRFIIKPYTSLPDPKLSDLNSGNVEKRKVHFVLTAF